MTQDVLDKFLKEVSYKFPKGYPDMKDPQDVKLLNKLVMEYTKSKTVIKESQEYDNLITKVLGPDVIPTQQYQLGQSTTLQGQDKENFQKLYSVAPGKKADQDGADQGPPEQTLLSMWQNCPLTQVREYINLTQKQNCPSTQ